MQKLLKDTLQQIEHTENVRILLAVEAGSRVWGFPLVDSGWNVRFLYLRSPEWYLSIRTQREDLAYPLLHDGLDLEGWDLRKALGLFAHSNPTLLEWLRSPIVYHEAYSAVPRLLDLIDQYFSPRLCLQHYWEVGTANYKAYLLDDIVPIRKYFYALRPLLACRWILTHNAAPPLKLQRLVDGQLPDSLQWYIKDLIDRDREGKELGEEPRSSSLNEFLEAEMLWIETQMKKVRRKTTPDVKALDNVFRAVLAEAWPRRKI